MTEVQAPDPAMAAEALLAVTGVFQEEPVTKVQGKQAKALPKEWRRAVVEFLDQRRPRPFRMPASVNVDKVRETLAAGIDAHRRASLVSLIDDPDVAEAYIEALARAWTYLQQRWPSATEETPVGPRSLPTGRTEVWRMAALVAVLDSPERVLDEMRMGTLTDEQAEAFRECYPELFSALKKAIWAELVRRYPTPERYDLSAAKEGVLRVLVGLAPDVSLSSAAPNQPPTPAPPSGKTQDFSALKSRAQTLGER